MRFGPQWTEIGCSSFESKHYLQKYRNNLLIMCAKQPVEEVLPKHPIKLKDNFIILV